MTKFLLIFYIVTLCILSVFSWGFVDLNFPLSMNFIQSQLVWIHPGLTTFLYCILVILLFISYGFTLRTISEKKMSLKSLLLIISSSVVILLFAFPGFSYDMFNYIATAKVTFLYKENPYVVMPMEIQNEPMLTFMHAANKVALYGIAWIGMTGIPFVLGLNNLLLTVFTFKAFVFVFYVLVIILIWKLSDKNMKSIALFALNPLVLFDILVSSHNDVVMMALALGSFYFFKKEKIVVSILLMLLSVFIKFATAALIPVYVYLLYLHVKERKISWPTIWKYSAIAMYGMFFLSPLREEIYSWYLIWPLTFVSLIPENKLLTWITFGFSFGLPFRIAPYIYTLSWAGITPLVKTLVTFIPPSLASLYYAAKKQA